MLDDDVLQSSGKTWKAPEKVVRKEADESSVESSDKEEDDDADDDARFIGTWQQTLFITLPPEGCKVL